MIDWTRRPYRAALLDGSAKRATPAQAQWMRARERMEARRIAQRQVDKPRAR